MTKRERLYHSLVKAEKLFEYKLAKKKLRQRNCKPSGIYIDMAVLRERSEHSNMSVTDLLNLVMTQKYFFI